MSPFQPYSVSLVEPVIEAEVTEIPPEPRRRGRPKGSTSTAVSTKVKYRPLSKLQKATISERLRFGETIQELADEYSVPIKRIVELVPQVRVDPGAAVGGRFQRAARIDLIDEMADAITTALAPADKPLSPTDIRNLSIAMGVVFDKRRLEEGLSTSNQEVHKTTRQVWSRREMPGK